MEQMEHIPVHGVKEYLLGLQDRIGSIAPGKDADLVLFDGDPFEYSSHVQAVVVDGVVRVEGPH